MFILHSWESFVINLNYIYMYTLFEIMFWNARYFFVFIYVDCRITFQETTKTVDSPDKAPMIAT